MYFMHATCNIDRWSCYFFHFPVQLNWICCTIEAANTVTYALVAHHLMLEMVASTYSAFGARVSVRSAFDGSFSLVCTTTLWNNGCSELCLYVFNMCFSGRSGNPITCSFDARGLYICLYDSRTNSAYALSELTMSHSIWWICFVMYKCSQSVAAHFGPPFAGDMRFPIGNNSICTCRVAYALDDLHF